MKRILIIISTAFVPFGGLTSVMMNYYRGIDKDRFKIDFASTNAEIDIALKNELKQNGSTYYCLGNRKRNPLGYIKNLRWVLKNNTYDVVHVNANSATAAIELVIAKNAGVPKRIDHNHTSICDHPTLHKLLYGLFKSSYTDAISCSKKAGEWIFKDSKYIILNNGIDSSLYRFNEENRRIIREMYNIPQDTFVVGHVGKIYKPKNHHFLIKLFSKLLEVKPDARLFLVGDGEMRKEIESDVDNRSIRDSVIFAGMQRKVYKYLSAMDVFVFPSIWEGMPLSLIEAQASGLRCVCSTSIDNESNVTGKVKRIGLDEALDMWVEGVLTCIEYDRGKESDDNINLIRRNGFDSRENALTLEKIYQS